MMRHWTVFVIIALISSACNLSNNPDEELIEPVSVSAVPEGGTVMPQNSPLIYWLGSENALNEDSIRIGCETYVTPFASSEAPSPNPNDRIFDGLQLLFNTAPEQNTSNYWYGQGLQVESVGTDDNGLARIVIRGDMTLVGTCADPVMLAQVLLVVFAEPGVQSAYITIGGRNMRQIFDMSGLAADDAVFTRDNIPYN